MAGKCSICSHPERSDIDQAILSQVSIRIIADRFSVSLGAINRHKAGHIPAAMAEAKSVEEVSRSGDLLDTTMSLLSEAQEITTESRKAGDLRTALDGIGKITNILKLLMAVTLALADRKDAEVDISQAPAWIETRTVILKALEPYPEARQAVAEALSS